MGDAFGPRCHPFGAQSLRLFVPAWHHYRMSGTAPYMMKLDTAARYCDLSRSAFIGEVAAGRLPSPVNLGGREHWLRPALEKALERIAGEMAADYEQEFWNRAQTA